MCGGLQWLGMGRIIINYSHNYRKQINILNLLCFRIGLGRPQWQQAAAAAAVANADENRYEKILKINFQPETTNIQISGRIGRDMGQGRRDLLDTAVLRLMSIN